MCVGTLIWTLRYFKNWQISHILWLYMFIVLICFADAEMLKKCIENCLYLEQLNLEENPFVEEMDNRLEGCSIFA